MHRGHYNLNRIMAALICGAVAFGTFTYSGAVNNPVKADSVSDLESKKEQNEKEIRDFQKKLDTIAGNASAKQEYQDTLTEKITVQEDNLNIIRGQVASAETSVEELNAEINQLEADIAQKQLDFDNKLETFKKRIRAMYIAGDDSIMSVFAGSTDLYDILAKSEYVSRISKNDTKLVEDLISQMKELDKQKADLDSEKVTLDENYKKLSDTEAQYSAQYDKLSADYEKTDYIIDMYAKESAQIQQDIANNNKENEKIDAEISEAIRKEQERLRKLEEERGKNNQTSSSDYKYTGEKFTWPVPGYYYISSPYGWRKLNGVKDFHGGIDIAGNGRIIYGSSVVAAAEGTVIKACPYDTYGNCIIVDHGADDNGTSYATLYAHLSEIDVSYGSHVNAGQTIGKVGETGRAYGAHLHFEVRVNGNRVNPMNFFSR